MFEVPLIIGILLWIVLLLLLIKLFLSTNILIPDFRSLLGQRLPDRDESLQHKSKEARPWKSQEGNQEEGGRVERGNLGLRTGSDLFWLFAGAFSGVQHIKGDSGKYQQDIPGS